MLAADPPWLDDAGPSRDPGHPDATLREIHLPADERHLACDGGRSVTVRDEPTDVLHRPSIDVLFHSLAGLRRPGVAVLLTGMGRDGADGLLALRRAGWWTIAQDQASSVVWGMPGEAVRLGAACEMVGIEDVPWAIGRALARVGERDGRAAGAAGGAA